MIGRLFAHLRRQWMGVLALFLDDFGDGGYNERRPVGGVTSRVWRFAPPRSPVSGRRYGTHALRAADVLKPPAIWLVHAGSRRPAGGGQLGPDSLEGNRPRETASPQTPISRQNDETPRRRDRTASARDGLLQMRV
jgi:hypothetical protein